MEDKIAVTLWIIGAIICIIIIIFMFKEKKECEEKGGVYLSREFVCIKENVIVRGD